MSESNSSLKPTLESLLTNPQIKNQQKIKLQKVLFPKINTKLKKTTFTKYHSAFISLKDIQNDKQEKDSFLKQKKQKKQKANTQKDEPRSRQKKTIHKSVWKLNKKYFQNYVPKSNRKYESEQSMSINQKQGEIKLDTWSQMQSRIKIQRDVKQGDYNLLKRQKKLQNSKQKTEIQQRSRRFNLATQIRRSNISPINSIQQYHNVQTGKDRKNRSIDQINDNINKSNKIISLIKKNHQQGFFEKKQQNKQSKQWLQLQQKLGLFSYLKRKFVTNKEELTKEKIRQYFKTPSDTSLQAKINFKSRQFLQQKLHHDYHAYNQVHRLREEMSQLAIQQEVINKNLEYHQQYSKKYNVPYLSFLSLPKKMKLKVLRSIIEPTLNQLKQK